MDLIEHSAVADDFHGWDPFDGLESRLFRSLPFSGMPLLRLAWQQLFKRSPVNLRPLALVPPTLNPVTVALFCRGYGVLGREGDQEALAWRLPAMRSRSWFGPGQGWGYPFDWQARAFAVPRDRPNVIATAYAVRALASAPRSDQGDCAIREAAAFVAGVLPRRRDGRVFLGYVPDADTMVHNANLWAAYVLAEGAVRGGSPTWAELARSAVDYSVSAQRADGSWPYGEAGHHGFQDSFHTGYNLEAINLCTTLLGREGRWDDAVSSGLDHYAATFFTADGQPRYYHDRLWPADPTCTGQALITLLEIRPTAERRELAGRVLDWTIRNLWMADRGAFAYQGHGRWMNRNIYIRWTQAWMFLGIALWLTKGRGEE
jgi:hypothetical protein